MSVAEALCEAIANAEEGAQRLRFLAPGEAKRLAELAARWRAALDAAGEGG